MGKTYRFTGMQVGLFWSDQYGVTCFSEKQKKQTSFNLTKDPPQQKKQKQKRRKKSDFILVKIKISAAKKTLYLVKF